MSDVSSDKGISDLSPVNFISQVAGCIDEEASLICSEIDSSVRVGSRNKQIVAIMTSLAADITEIKARSERVIGTLRGLRTTPDVLAALNNTLLPASGSIAKLTTLISTITDLEKEIEDNTQFGYYRTVSDLFTEAKQQISSFDIVALTPLVSDLQMRLSRIQKEVERQVHWAFREIGQLVEDNPESVVFTGELPAPIQALLDVSLLVTALGEVFLKDVLERFSQLQLIPYERKFMPGKEFAGLEHLEQRWKWFRALMDCFDKKLSDVFPSVWRTKYYMYLDFVRRTKIHLKVQLQLLEEKALKSDEHVAVLLKAMKSVLTFSGEMKAKLDIPELAREYEEQILSECVNDAFDDFLEPYVKVERNALDELIQSTLLREEQSAVAAQEAKEGSGLELAIYESSGKIFEYIKRSVQRCSKFSTGHTLIELSMEFRVCLQQYANSLSRRMPLPCDEIRYIKERVIDFEVKEGMPHTYHVTPESAVVVCRVMRTGEYCADTIPQLETLMKQLIRPSLEKEVEFMSPVDTFCDLCNKATAILIAGAMNRIEKGSFRSFRGTNWGIVTEHDMHVGTESKYIGQLSQDLSSLIPDHRKILSVTYYRNFCTKLSVAILDKFRAYLLRQKRISPFGARQLLIDCDAMLHIVSNLGNIGLLPGDEQTPILPASLKIISERMIYIQIILKLIQLDEAVLDSSFRVMLPNGKAEDLKLIKEIRNGRDLSVSDQARQAVETLKPSNILPAFNFDFGFGSTTRSKTTPQKIDSASTTPQGNPGAGAKPSGGR